MSASTISRALAKHPRISVKTRERVQKTAAEMNYRPNHLASNLRRGKGKLIGVIIPRINRHFFSHAIAGMETITNPAGYNLIICQTNEDFESEKLSLQTLINNRVDGIIVSVASGTRTANHFQAAINEKIPLLFFDRIVEELDTDRVVNDNFAGAYEVTKHLIEQGFRNITHLAGPLHINVYKNRYTGYLKAMEEAGIEVLPEMVIDNCLTRDKGEQLAQEICNSGTLPDAIFSASDYSALGVYLVFKQNGIEIPNDVGLAGFANEPFTEFLEPSITTLEQFGEDMGQSVARMLIDRLESKDEKKFTSSVSFKPKLIIRESTVRKNIQTY
jgi:LacI family transcriptional regulator